MEFTALSYLNSLFMPGLFLTYCKVRYLTSLRKGITREISCKFQIISVLHQEAAPGKGPLHLFQCFNGLWPDSGDRGGGGTNGKWISGQGSDAREVMLDFYAVTPHCAYAFCVRIRPNQNR